MIPTFHHLRNKPALGIYNGFSLSVPITSIREVRVGSTTDAFTQCPEVYAEDRCFSIIHGDEFSTLDLVFPTQDDSIHWTVGLRYLLAKNSGIKIGDLHVYVNKTGWTMTVSLSRSLISVLLIDYFRSLL